MNTLYKNLSLWLVIALIGVLLVNLLNPSKELISTLSYNDFLSHVEDGNIKKIKITGDEIIATELSGEQFKTIMPANPETVQPFVKAGLQVQVVQKREPPWYVTSLISWVPMLLFLGVVIFFMKQSQKGGGKGLMSMGKSRARLIEGEASKVTFEDVAGIEEAREELAEIVDFLKSPEMFTNVGARIPKGVMLSGEPGTGKTLLAKAIAGEAKVPFFSISGADFVEMYVGIGASRVRDLFKQAKKKAPCIIFIDEIDAVGRHRSSGMSGGSDEREQTLNQLLVEMDGFEVNAGIIIVAATNRPDILDPALMRPGRFDRQVTVPVPDVRGREKILQVHAKKVPLADDVDWTVIAKGTPGFSGADLENMVNEAALMAVRSGVDKISMMLLDKAKDKVMMGAERQSMIITEKEKKVTAYHEAGHALVAKLLPGSDPVHKVTIIPRGKALGLTMQLPAEEMHSQSKSYLMNKLCILLGGRVAEELIFGEITTGSGNDIDRVSEMARRMVCEWGMSNDIGPLTFGDMGEGGGAQGGHRRQYSGETAVLIDKAVKDMVVSANEKVTRLLDENRSILKAMADALLEKETIMSEDIDAMMVAAG